MARNGNAIDTLWPHLEVAGGSQGRLAKSVPSRTLFEYSAIGEFALDADRAPHQHAPSDASGRCGLRIKLPELFT
jgi:hypothetical protein